MYLAVILVLLFATYSNKTKYSFIWKYHINFVDQVNKLPLTCILSNYSRVPPFKIKSKSTIFSFWMKLKLTIKTEAATSSFSARKHLFKTHSSVIRLSFCCTLRFTITLYCADIWEAVLHFVSRLFPIYPFSVKKLGNKFLEPKFKRIKKSNYYCFFIVTYKKCV